MTNLPAPAARFVTHDLPNQAATAAVVRRSRWRAVTRGPINKACLVVIAAYVVVGLLSIVPVPDSIRSVAGLSHVWAFDDLIKHKYDSDHPYAPPAWSFTDKDGVHHVAVWLGQDFAGHSIFWQTLYGTRTALLITILTSILVLSIGTTLGMIAGYFGGWVDDGITWVYSVLNTIPWLLLVAAVTYVLQRNAELNDAPYQPPGPVSRFFHDLLPGDLVIVVLALGLTDWVSLCRLIRGEVIKLRDSDMVAAGRALGLSEARILFRHILPNVSHLIIITFTLGAVSYLQVEVILSFLGLGVSSKPSWGAMIDSSRLSLIRGVWWEAAAATTAIFVICMALALLGDSLRDALDPKTLSRD